MNKNINIVELASELAHERMKIYLCLDDEDVWVNDGNDCLRYTDEAQDAFNQWYDYYYDLIEKI
jgi:hypothetical protein